MAAVLPSRRPARARIQSALPSRLFPPRSHGAVLKTGETGQTLESLRRGVIQVGTGRGRAGFTGTAAGARPARGQGPGPGGPAESQSGEYESDPAPGGGGGSEQSCNESPHSRAAKPGHSNTVRLSGLTFNDHPYPTVLSIFRTVLASIAGALPSRHRAPTTCEEAVLCPGPATAKGMRKQHRRHDVCPWAVHHQAIAPCTPPA
jgi:hypothetical protein